MGVFCSLFNHSLVKLDLSSPVHRTFDRNQVASFCCILTPNQPGASFYSGLWLASISKDVTNRHLEFLPQTEDWEKMFFTFPCCMVLFLQLPWNIDLQLHISSKVAVWSSVLELDNVKQPLKPRTFIIVPLLMMNVLTKSVLCHHAMKSLAFVVKDYHYLIATHFIPSF